LASVDYLKYGIQKIFLKGGFGVFLSLAFVFLLGYTIIVSLRFLMIYFLPESEDVFHDISRHMWVTYLAMTDPGNMNQDNESHLPFKVTAMLAGFLGVVIFSTVIAFITTTLESNYFKLRKGRNKFLESNHTLILGWNEKIVDIIRELIYANESLGYASIVILAENPKEEMDEIIEKDFPNSGRTQIFATSGNTGSISELKRINASKAKSVIILANCSECANEEEKELSDINSIKTIMAIYACQGNLNKLPIILEFFQPKKSELIKFFNDPQIIALENWKIMGKLLLQSSLTAGLIRVYDEMLSFKGNEIYIIPYNGPVLNFYELSHYYMNCIPLGIKNGSGDIIMRPSKETKITIQDHVIILAEDDSTIKMSKNKITNFSKVDFSPSKGEKKVKKTLILGWHEIAYHYLLESKYYLQVGSSFDIAIHHPNKIITNSIDFIKKTNLEQSISVIDINALIFNNLESLQPYSYDTVIILPQNPDVRAAEKNDTDTLIILMMLRQIKTMHHHQNTNTKVISQILKSDNQDLTSQTEIDDFICSNRLIDMIIAQLSEQPAIKDVFDSFFNNDGSEIYIKPLKYYVKQTDIQIYTFMDLADLAYKRDEICMGICLKRYNKDLSKNFGVVLNPTKNAKFEMGPDDYLVVLSEDDL